LKRRQSLIDSDFELNITIKIEGLRHCVPTNKTIQLLKNNHCHVGGDLQVGASRLLSHQRGSGHLN